MAATKKILVTGGAGFIGSFIVDELTAKGHEVVIFDNLDAQVHPGGKKPPYLNRKAKFVLGDVQEPDSIKKALKAEKPEVIYHEAAAVGVGQSMYEIRRYVSVNDIGAANLLQAVLESNIPIKKLIVASSMSIYGEGRYLCGKCGPVDPPLRKSGQLESRKWEMTCPACHGSIVAPVPTDEEKPLKPTSVYAVTKRTQEELFLSYGRAYGIPTVAFRYFNVYGPRQALSNPYTGVVAIFSSRIKNGNPPVVFEDGFQSRDFVSVHDIARANVMALDRGDGCYNVGSGKPVSILEIANALIRLYGKKLKPEVRNRFRKGDIRHCFADISRIKKELGWSPETKFDDGMRELIGWAGHEEARDGFEKAEKEMKRWGL